MKKPLVSVVMITYAHENFIEQAINSILMQVCDFEVELIIANDCSPDNTDVFIREIINNHPNSSWIKYINHEKNMGMMPNFIWALQQCNGKYIAMCEGDDYWTDPYKLQKQVDFLENNEECVGCFTQCKILYNDLSSRLYNKWSDITRVKFDDFIYENLVATNTLVFRRKLLSARFFESAASISAGDWHLNLFLTQYGDMIYLPELMSVYRRHPNGVWFEKEEWMMIGKEIRLILQLSNTFSNQSTKSTFDDSVMMKVNQLENHCRSLLESKQKNNSFIYLVKKIVKKLFFYF